MIMTVLVVNTNVVVRRVRIGRAIARGAMRKRTRMHTCEIMVAQNWQTIVTRLFGCGILSACGSMSACEPVERDTGTHNRQWCPTLVRTCELALP